MHRILTASPCHPPWIQRFLERGIPPVKKQQPYVGCNRAAKVIYVAGPLTGPNEGINTQIARHYALKLFEKGHTPIVPHTNNDYCPLDMEHYRQAMHCCLDLIHRVDAVFMIPGWEQSLGARCERYAAYATGRTVYYDLHDVPDVSAPSKNLEELGEIEAERFKQAQDKQHNQ